MSSNKIIYGIDLGTTNSAIAKYDNGQAVVKKSMFQSDTTPSCVYITPKGQEVVGHRAYAQLSKDLRFAFTKYNYQNNTFIEFKRIMGTTEKVYSSHLAKNGREPYLSPEELSAAVLSTLRSYVHDEDVREAVITVPAHFNDNQKNATKAAAMLAGFHHFELIQEPVAASVAYGIGTKMKNAYWLVFDLGGGTFDAALMKIEDGIMRAIDTAGNNHLGGKDIDNAIVEQIIIPYLRENYTIDECLQNKAFTSMWKPKAEEAKIILSTMDTFTLETDLGDDYGCDDDGTDFELSLAISQIDLDCVQRPIFQQAIDITKALLRKNHLTGQQLGALILVGGPTYSPLLRRMLREQVTHKVDTSIDPMTAVACGAALYGSTIDVPEDIVDAKRDRSKIQLSVIVKSTSVEDVEYAAVKFLKDKCEGYHDDKVFVDFVRRDNLFSTGRVCITEQGDAVELWLKPDSTNVFLILCYDALGNKLECEPNTVSIIHGIDGIGDAVMPLHYGFGSVDANNDVIFTPFEGLRKNMPLPGVGKNSKKVCTERQLRPGMTTDIIKIPILQTDKDVSQLSQQHKKLKMIYCTHTNDVIITGDDVPQLLPMGSEINITAYADKSGTIEKFLVDIPHLDLTLDLTTKMREVRLSDDKYDLYIAEIADARKKIKELNDDQLSQELDEASCDFDNATDRDAKDKAVEQLKDILSRIDIGYSLGDWQRMERKLRNMYTELEDDNRKYGNEKTTTLVQQLKDDVDRAIKAQDIDAAQRLYDRLWGMDFDIAEVDYYKAWIRRWDRDFHIRQWSNLQRARTLVDQGLDIIKSNDATADNLRPIVIELQRMLPATQKPQHQGLLRQH